MEPAQYQAYLKGILRLSANGKWHHNGTPFSNKKLSDFFFRSIIWNEQKQEYILRVGLGEANFDCDDTAYFVTAVHDGSVPWRITLSDGTSEALDPNSLTTGKEDQLYCTVKQTHRARFFKNCYQQVVQHCVSANEIQIGDQVHTIKSNQDG